MKFTTPVSSVEIVDDHISPLDVVREIANQPDQEEPFFVVDLSDIVKKHKIWKLKLPRVEPYYAVKCNDTTTVLQVLATLGVGFDCASKGEIQKVLDLGVDKSRIIYANPCKTVSFIKYAAGQGVSLMTFDNEAELHKIKVVFPTAKLVVRIRCDDVKARCPLGVKFGVDAEKAIELLQVAKRLELNVVGVSFHVGSGCEDASAYYAAIKSCRNLFGFAEQLGFNFDLVDLGGGFPGQKNSIIAFDEVASVIDRALDEFFPVGCGVRIIAEPGRYYVASAFTLCTNIIGKRSVQPEKGDVSHMYYINDGVYGSFNCLLYDHVEVSPLPLKEPKWATTSVCSVWGPTCDGLDRVVRETVLPTMDIGDWMFFEDMGAYTVAAGSTFNGFQKPGLNFIASESTWLYLQQEMEVYNAGQMASPLPIMKTGIDMSVEDVHLEKRPMFSEISVVDV